MGKDAESLIAEGGEVEFFDREETAKEMVEVLAAEGADVIVAITHQII
ncbi:MAG: hypothetical protein ACOC5A_06735 [Halanaerobiales bacterium]